MNERNVWHGGAGQHGAGVRRLPRVRTNRPQPRNHHDRFRGLINEVGLAGVASGGIKNSLCVVPFIPAAGGQQAALPAETIAPHWFGRCLFHPRVERQARRFGFAPPRRDKSPPRRLHRQTAIRRLNEDGHRPGGRHVGAGLPSGLDVAPDFGPAQQHGLFVRSDVASTHGLNDSDEAEVVYRQ